MYLDERIITEILTQPDNFFSRSRKINFNFLPDEETLKKLYGKGIKRINYLHRPDLSDLYRTMKMHDLQKGGAQQSTDQQSDNQQGGASTSRDKKRRHQDHDARMMKVRKNHKHGQEDGQEDQDQMDEQDEHGGGSTHKQRSSITRSSLLFP